MRVHTVALLALASVALHAAEVAIRRADPADAELAEHDVPAYTVQARTYAAEVFPNGRVHLLAGKTVLISNLVLELGRKARTLGNLHLDEKEHRITLREGEPPKKGQPAKGGTLDTMSKALSESMDLPDLPGFTLHFLPDKVEIIPASLRAPKGKGKEQPPVFDISGVFGDDAVTVKNLRSGDADALPANYICSRHIFSFYQMYGRYWPDIEVAYADGTRLELRGITGVSHYAIGKGDPYTNEALKGKRGYFGLREAKGENVITLAIRAADAKAAVSPAPYFTVRPDKPRSLFYEDERVVYHLDFAEPYLVPGKWLLRWRIEDHMQREVGTGEQPVTIEPGKVPEVAVDLTPKEMGYFRARLTLSRPDAKAAQRIHDVSFSRVRPEAPKLRDLDGKGGADGEMLWANILGMRGIRLNPSFANTWREHHKPDGSIDWEAWAKKFAAYLEPAKQGTLKGFFSFTGLDWSGDLDKWFAEKYPDAEQRKKAMAEAKQRYLTDYAREAAKLGVAIWEPINEPDLGMPPEKYIEDVLKFQYPAVKAGNPQVNFLGGSLCGLDKYRWLRRLYELGGDKFFDGVSFHPYTGVGFQEVYRSELDEWWQVLRDFKDTSHGIWMTESAWHRGWMFNDYVYDRFNAFRQSQARHAALMHLNAEAMAIPRDRIYDFYLVEHGYNEFFLVTYNYPTPAAISIQVMNECLRDAKFQREVPLPTFGHYFQLYRDDTRTVAVAFTGDEPAELTLATDAAEVVATDLMGNRRALEPEGGKLRLTISGDPTYLVVGAKNKIEPVLTDLRVQPNLALTTLGATASASSVAKPKKGEPLPPVTALAGDPTCWSSAGALTGARRGWDEDESSKDQWPDWFEVKLPKPVPVARVRVVHDYGAWERVLRDWDVQASVNGQWKTVDQVRGNRYRFVTDHRFEPVTTDRVRVLVTAVNSCLFEDIPWIPKLSTLRAVEVFGPPGAPARAFFINELPKKRILAPGGEAELLFRIQNATNDPVRGEVRLKLPEGVTADTMVQKVSMGGDAVCVFKVKLSDQAPEGLYTVVAGLYEGDALISPDFATRVLCCKKPQK
ncbi:MAG TPA: discoidin domain-containing protein [Planctomycetota bacterium]|nr:discoidin domain-containing protein [Planctomycetota bacterium]